MRFPRILALLVLLGGCATAFPETALQGVDRTVSVSALRQDPMAFVGRTVMAGGEILATRPMPGTTEVELLANALDPRGRPRQGDDSEGRIIVRTTRFLDPAVYAERRLLTVIGTVSGEEERKIGDLPYRYPVLMATHIRLWPRETASPPAPWPYYYPWPYDYPWPYLYGWQHRVWGPWPYWW